MISPSIRNNLKTNPPKTTIRKVLSLFSNPNLIFSSPNTKFKVEIEKPYRMLENSWLSI
ncbi:MAG: hypothetical protein RBR74_11765 [Ignavibacteriaceae bacterium]|nr:hypothetical protein [Ignavibacteriaceae bacterium]